MKTPPKSIIIIFVVLNASLAISNSDVGLIEMHNSGVLIYSVLWAAFNPWYWTKQLYNFYLLTPQTLMMILEWELVKRKRLSPLVFLASQLTALEWRALQVPQEITVTLFQSLGTIFPPAVLLAPLQKFPWTLSPTHETTQALPCYTFDCWGLAHFIRYWVLVFWVIFPVVIWVYRRYSFKQAKCVSCTSPAEGKGDIPP